MNSSDNGVEMRYFRLIRYMVLCGLFFLAACAGLMTPTLETSEYFKTLSNGFVGTMQKSGVLYHYGITIMPLKKLSPDNYVEVTFENPGGDSPFLANYNVSDMKTLDFIKNVHPYRFDSPVVHGVRPHTNYLIRVSLYDDSSKSRLLGIHEQLVNSGYIEN